MNSKFECAETLPERQSTTTITSSSNCQCAGTPSESSLMSIGANDEAALQCMGYGISVEATMCMVPIRWENG